MGGPVQAGPKGPSRHTKDKEPHVESTAAAHGLRQNKSPCRHLEAHCGHLDSAASAGTSGMVHRNSQVCTTLPAWKAQRGAFLCPALFQDFNRSLCFIENNPLCSLGHAGQFLDRLPCPLFPLAFFGLTGYYSSLFLT